jgi:hypothetical protein
MVAVPPKWRCRAHYQILPCAKASLLIQYGAIAQQPVLESSTWKDSVPRLLVRKGDRRREIGMQKHSWWRRLYWPEYGSELLGTAFPT